MSFVVLVCCFLILSQDSAAEGQRPREVTVRPGEDVTLQCQGPRDSTITLLEWIRPDLKSDGYVFFYRNDRPYENYQHPSFRGRVKLRDKSLLKDGDMSVILKNVTDQDSGAYECRIISSAMEGNERTYKEVRDLINLTVTHSGENVVTGADTDKLITDRGNEGGPSMQIVGVTVGVFVVAGIVGVGYMICRKRKENREPSYGGVMA